MDGELIISNSLQRTHATEQMMPRQGELLHTPVGDARLLEPGYAGALAQDEVDYIREQLFRDKSLARLWGFKSSSKRRPEQIIRALASQGDPSSGRANAELARRPASGMA